MPREANDFVDELLEQHRTIETAAKRLRSLMHAPLEERAAFLREIRQQVKTLSRSLAEHFESEDRSGKFEELEESFPHLIPAINRIRGEHERLKARLKAVLDGAGSLESEFIEKAGKLERLFEEFYTRLVRHENDEIELVQKAHQTDICGSD